MTRLDEMLDSLKLLEERDAVEKDEATRIKTMLKSSDSLRVNGALKRLNALMSELRLRPSQQQLQRVAPKRQRHEPKPEPRNEPSGPRLALGWSESRDRITITSIHDLESIKTLS